MNQDKLTKIFPKPEPKLLRGQCCELQVFDKHLHAHKLYEAFSLDKKGSDWDYLPYGPFYSKSAFLEWVDTTCVKGGPIFYAVCIDKYLEPVGITSFLNIEPEHGKIEIGHVHFSPKLQRTAAGTEAHYLLLQFAFDQLGYRRVEWKCDNANERSKRCAKRLGFTSEGIFRQHWIMKSRNRDTAWFSIIDTEWPSIKRNIGRWLDPANFTRDGCQIKKISDM